MDKSETEKYAELIISMSADYLLSKISEYHYKHTLETIIINLVKK